MAALDALSFALAALIAALFFTGGIHYDAPQAKLELSQIDPFACALLACLAIRRWRSGHWLPSALERWAKRASDALTRRPAATVAIAAATYVVLHTWVSAWRFDSFHANAFDLGFVDQSLWSTTRVGFLRSSLSKGQTYLGEHFSPILGGIALLYRVWDSVYALFFLQSLVLSSGSILVYVLAREKRIERPVAALLSICYLLYHPLRAANGFDFREDALFIPVFLGALLAADKKRWLPFWILCGLSWTIKENAQLFTGLIGLWLALSSRGRARARERALGLALFGISLALFYAVNTRITPYFAGGGTETMAAKRLRHLGGTGGEILAFIVTHPFRFLGEIARPMLQWKTLKYVIEVATPFWFFAPSAPLVAGIAALGMLMNLAVNQPTIGFHYECILIPFLFYVLVHGVARAHASARLGTTTGGFLLVLSFFLFFGRSPVDSIRRFSPTEHHRLVSAELSKIPADASVATQSALFPHVSHRREARFLTNAPTEDFLAADFTAELERYLPSDSAKPSYGDRYEKVVDRDSFVIWRKVAPASGSARKDVAPARMRAR